MIKPNAGKMRGVRVVRDPDGILLDSFVDETGMQYGYIAIYGEEAPAVHDGEQWHSITDKTAEEWEAALHDLLVEQGTKIAKAAATSPVYAELAKVMNIMVGAGVADSGLPANTIVFNS